MSAAERFPEFPNWFELYADSYFEKWLRPLAGREGLAFLQIGAYVGDASAWMIDEVLTAKHCHLDDVDTWGGSAGEPAHDGIDFTAVEALYDWRMKGLNQPQQRATKHKTTSLEYLLTERHRRYDFVYVDGAHTAPDALADAVLAWPLLKEGGLMAFDDYLWEPYEGAPPEETPAPAIDAFLFCHRAELEVVDKGQQVWVRKKGAA